MWSSCVRITTSVFHRIQKSFKRQKIHSIRMVLACHPCASFVERKTFTKNWKRKSHSSTEPKTRFCTRLHSTQTVEYLNRFLAKKMPSFPMNWTTRRSSMVCVCVKRNATATSTPTWRIWKNNWKRRKHNASESLLQTGYFPWTATLPKWTKFATSRINTTRSSWQTNVTPLDSSAKQGAVYPNTATYSIA